MIGGWCAYYTVNYTVIIGSRCGVEIKRAQAINRRDNVGIIGNHSEMYIIVLAVQRAYIKIAHKVSIQVVAEQIR